MISNPLTHVNTINENKMGTKLNTPVKAKNAIKKYHKQSHKAQIETK